MQLLIVVGVLVVGGSRAKVIELTDLTFDSNIAKYDNALVIFHTPWCGHCQRIKPEFETASQQLEKGTNPVHLLSVDCNEEGKVTCSRLRIPGYPTLKLYKKGKVFKEYDGPRFSDGIVKSLIFEFGPSFKELTTKEELDSFLQEPKTLVVLYWKEESEVKRLFEVVASLMKQNVRFGLYKSDEEKIVLYQAAHLRNKFEPSEYVYQDSPKEKSDLETWIKANQHGLVGHRHPQNKDDFKFPLVVAYYRVDYTKNPKGSNYWRNRILKTAQTYSKDFNFAISSKEDFSHELSVFSVTMPRTDKPVVYAWAEGNKKYAMEGEFSTLSFEKFLSGLKSGSIPPYLKSEPIPEPTDEAVVPVVAKNYDEVIEKNGKDTLLAFYAHWCGHCRQLAPVYLELAERLKDEDLVVAKMNAASNEVPPEFEIDGYPTLYFIPKDRRIQPLKYKGTRDMKSLIAFVARHSTFELYGYNRDGTPRKDEL